MKKEKDKKVVLKKGDKGDDKNYSTTYNKYLGRMNENDVDRDEEKRRSRQERLNHDMWFGHCTRHDWLDYVMIINNTKYEASSTTYEVHSR